MNIQQLLEEYEELSELEAIKSISTFKEIIEDLEQEKYQNDINYINITKDSLFDVFLAISKFKKLLTTELREDIKQSQNFLKEKNFLIVQFDFYD